MFFSLKAQPDQQQINQPPKKRFENMTPEEQESFVKKKMLKRELRHQEIAYAEGVGRFQAALCFCCVYFTLPFTTVKNFFQQQPELVQDKSCTCAEKMR